MVIADVRVLHHVLQVADQLGGVQVVAAGRDQRLVHVQGVGEGGAYAAEVDPALGQKHGPVAVLVDHPCQLLLGARDIGYAVDVFGPFGHFFVSQVVATVWRAAYLWRMCS